MTKGQGDPTERLPTQERRRRHSHQRLEQLHRFFPKIQSYHCLLNVCSYKIAPTRTLFGPGRLGAPRGCTATSHFHLLSYGETPSYLNKRVVRSFNLPYIALLPNIPTNRTSPFSYGYEQLSLTGHALGSQGCSLRDKQVGTRKKE